MKPMSSLCKWLYGKINYCRLLFGDSSTQVCHVPQLLHMTQKPITICPNPNHTAGLGQRQSINYTSPGGEGNIVHHTYSYSAVQGSIPDYSVTGIRIDLHGVERVLWRCRMGRDPPAISGSGPTWTVGPRTKCNHSPGDGQVTGHHQAGPLL